MKDKPTAEFLLEMGELIVDAVTTTNAVRELPVVGSAFKAVRRWKISIGEYLCL